MDKETRVFNLTTIEVREAWSRETALWISVWAEARRRIAFSALPVETSVFLSPGPRLIDGVEQLAAILHPASYGRHLPASVERLEGQTTHSH